MQHYHSLSEASLPPSLPTSWLTIGSFDGIHRGHQAVIRTLVEGAHQAGAAAVVMTFFPHPSVVLGKRRDPMYLTLPDERAALLAGLGVDVLITQPFTLELAALSPEEFMRQVSEQLRLRRLLVGHDFALGRGRAGDPERLAEIGQDLGYTLDLIRPVQHGQQVISSSAIRAALAEGNVAAAAEMLGRAYTLSGQIIPGDGRGRTIGIPTANLDIPAGRVIPKAGVYACTARLVGAHLVGAHPVGAPLIGAMTNIGVRPTFENGPAEARVETHLLDYSGDLYGQTLELAFIERLRDEQRFPSVDALIAQIRADIERGKEILSRVVL